MTTDARIIFDDELDLDIDIEQAEARRVEQEKRRAEEQELLAKAGLEQPPTAEEAKALLDARRAEIRKAVLVEADKRDWCIDGTRKVCANLRLERPGDRSGHIIEVEFTVKMVMETMAYTSEGATHRLFNRSVLSQTWLRNQLYAKDLTVTPHTLAVNSEPVDLSSFEADQKPEVSA